MILDTKEFKPSVPMNVNASGFNPGASTFVPGGGMKLGAEFNPSSAPFTMGAPAKPQKSKAVEAVEALVKETFDAKSEDAAKEADKSDQKSSEEMTKQLTETVEKISSEFKERTEAKNQCKLSVNLLTTFLSQVKELKLAESQVSHCISSKIFTRDEGTDKPLPDSFKRGPNPNRGGKPSHH